MRSSPSKSWLMAALLVCGTAMAEPPDGAGRAAPASAADSQPVSFPLGFGAEWDGALHRRDVPRVKALMQRARGQMPINKSGESPLHRLPSLHELGDAVPVMQALLASGTDVHASTPRGYTPLHMAVASACTPCVQLLLRAGARVLAASQNGTTPLHMSQPDHRAALLTAGADITARYELGRAPLHTATPPSEALMGAGVGINVVDAHGFTPLHWAAFNGRHLDATWLLAHGADPRLRSTAAYVHSDGILAAEWATRTTYPSGLRAYDLAKTQHDATKWSSGTFRQVWEVLDKATPRQGLLSR